MSMLSRLVLGLGVLAAAIVALLLSLPLLMPSQLVREQVAAQISDLTGRAVSLRGDQALRVFPSLSVELSDVAIGGNLPGSDQPLVVTEALRGAVRPLPLLFGRIEMASFEMTRPTIRLYRGADGQSNWQLDGSELESALEPGSVSGRALQLGRFQITDGTVQYIDEGRGISETITSANVTLTWPSSSTRAIIGGSAIWRGEAVTFSAALGQPAALAQPGSTSGVDLSLQSAPLQVDFDGTVSPGRGGENPLPWQATGPLTLSTPSLRRTAFWLGSEMDSGSTLGAFELDADVNLVGTTLDMTDARLSLDGNEAEGVLTLDLDGYRPENRRPSIQGTLDFAQLDLSPYVDMLRPTTTAQAPDDWRFWPLPDVFTVPLDMDVRFAARQVMASQLSFGETGGSLLLSEDQMVLGIGQTQGYGGEVRGSLSINRRGQARDHSLDLSVLDLDLGALLGALNEQDLVDGTLSGQLLLSGQGGTVAQVLESVEGDGMISLVDGTLSGIDIDTLAQRFVEEAGNIEGLSLGGSTGNVSLTSNLFVQDGFLNLQDTLLQTQQVSVTLTGQGHMIDGSLDLEGATAKSRSDQTVVVPFEVLGTISAPQFLPDTSALTP